MFYPNGNNHYAAPEADYWRARAEELERQLAETRLLLMQVVGLLPAEHLSKLTLNLVQLNAAKLNGPHAAAWPESSVLAE